METTERTQRVTLGVSLPRGIRVAILAGLNLGVSTATWWTPFGFSVFMNDMFEISQIWATVLIGVGLGVLEALWWGRAAAWAAVVTPLGLVLTSYYVFLVGPSVVAVSLGALAGVALVRGARGLGRAPWFGAIGSIGVLVIVVTIAVRSAPA